jgi:two-component system NarL family response regulator
VTGSSAIRVLVVEDNFYTRVGTVAFLRTQPGVEVVGEAANGAQALELVERFLPDVVVVDLRMPAMDGVELTALLSRRKPRTPVLVLSHYQGDHDVAGAIRAGARGFLTKEAPAEDLVRAIRAVHSGDRYLPPEIVERLASHAGEPELTRRERQVLEHMANGASNRDIGRALELSERTVGIYVSRILSKLDARSRGEAVAIGVKRGIVQIPGPAS